MWGTGQRGRKGSNALKRCHRETARKKKPTLRRRIARRSGEGTVDQLQTNRLLWEATQNIERKPKKKREEGPNEDQSAVQRATRSAGTGGGRKAEERSPGLSGGSDVDPSNPAEMRGHKASGRVSGRRSENTTKGAVPPPAVAKTGNLGIRAEKWNSESIINVNFLRRGQPSWEKASLWRTLEEREKR